MEPEARETCDGGPEAVTQQKSSGTTATFQDAFHERGYVVHKRAKGRHVPAGTFGATVSPKVESLNGEALFAETFGMQLVSTAVFRESVNQDDHGRRSTLREPAPFGEGRAI